jgi:hypothetical protein
VRRKHALILFACLAAAIAVAPAGRSQDDGIQPYFWPNRTVGIPVNVDQIAQLAQKPSDLQLFYAVNRGAFQKGPKLPLNAMQALDGGKKGFLFTAERDGDFEFTVQFVYADGSTSPRADELTPQQRIVVDTTPPVVRVQPSNNGVEWIVSDDNLDSRGVTLQCKWPGSREWTTVTDRAFRTADRYAWQLQPGKVLEARVLAKDRAGNSGISPVVRVPPDAASGAGLTRPAPGGPAWAGGGTPNLPAPRIDYVNTNKFDVDYSIQRMGRSGVKAAHLFVLRNQGSWELVKRFEQSLMPGDKKQNLSLPYEATEEGTYGFYVIPESGAGEKEDNPRKDDQPMLYVVVDTTPPYVKITSVQVKPGGTRGPLVEITWEAADPNLMPQPVSLEWSLDRAAPKWNEIKYRLDNNLNPTSTGRYTWEVPDENLWKFWIRARAVDKASNSNEFIWPQEVIVDLEKPSATINKVRGGTEPPGSPDQRLPGGSDGPPIRPEPGPTSSDPPRLPGLPPTDPPKLPGSTGPEVPPLPKLQ